MKRVLTVGVFDYFHYGHLRLFLQAKAVCPDSYLVVAVQESEFIHATKPNADVFYSTEVRKELVSALRCVDEVTTYTNICDSIKNIDFDVFAVGEDQNHPGFQKAMQWCESNGRQVVRLKRTQGVSSTQIKTQIK